MHGWVYQQGDWSWGCVLTWHVAWMGLADTYAGGGGINLDDRGMRSFGHAICGSGMKILGGNTGRSTMVPPTGQVLSISRWPWCNN